MIEPTSDFERWAVSQKMDIEHARDLGYLSERTNISYKAWLGCMEQVRGGLLFEYGICPDCGEPYVEQEITEELIHPSMECGCTVEQYRETKIMKLLDDEAINRIESKCT